MLLGLLRLFWLIVRRRLEDGDFRAAPALDALAVAQSFVHVEMPALDAVIPVRVMPIQLGRESSAQGRLTDLPAVRVAAEHPLPGVTHKLHAEGGVVKWPMTNDQGPRPNVLGMPDDIMNTETSTPYQIRRHLAVARYNRTVENGPSLDLAPWALVIPLRS